MYKKILCYRGFTLIELLVVIAIIGILASVVLAALNTSRNKAVDAKIIATVRHTQAQAERYWDSPSRTYTDLCVDAGIVLASSSVGEYGSSLHCDFTSNSFIMYAPLVYDSGAYFCVDANGYLGRVTSAPVGLQCN